MGRQADLSMTDLIGKLLDPSLDKTLPAEMAAKILSAIEIARVGFPSPSTEPDFERTLRRLCDVAEVTSMWDWYLELEPEQRKSFGPIRLSLLDIGTVIHTGLRKFFDSTEAALLWNLIYAIGDSWYEFLAGFWGRLRARSTELEAAALSAGHRDASLLKQILRNEFRQQANELRGDEILNAFGCAVRLLNDEELDAILEPLWDHTPSQEIADE